MPPAACRPATSGGHVRRADNYKLTSHGDDDLQDCTPTFPKYCQSPLVPNPTFAHARP